MCCGGKSNKKNKADFALALAIKRNEYHTFCKWRNRAIYATIFGFGLALALLKIYYLQLHFQATYADAEREASHNQTIGNETYEAGGCASRPAGYKTPLLNCELASQWKDLDPHSHGLETAIWHLVTDHLSPLSWITGCHNGTCNSFLWLLGEKILLHYQLTLFLIVLAGSLAGFLALYLYYHCHRAHIDYRQTAMQVASSGTVQTANRLLTGLNDAITAVSSGNVPQVAQLDALHAFLVQQQQQQQAQTVSFRRLQGEREVVQGREALAIKFEADENGPAEPMKQVVQRRQPTAVRQKYALAGV